MFKKVQLLLHKPNQLAPRGKSIAVFLVLTSIGLWFYWFQWRPAEIRRECSDLELKKFLSLTGGKIEMEKGISSSSLNKVYRTCLARSGLKPENLFNEE